MPSLKSIRFQKYDAYNNAIFIASSKKPDEVDNYNELKSLADKLEEKQYNTFMPIYHSTEYNYSTIRFKKNEKMRLSQNATYNVEYKIKKITKDNKIYINCYIDKIKLVGKAVVQEEGEEIDL